VVKPKLPAKDDVQAKEQPCAAYEAEKEINANGKT